MRKCGCVLLGGLLVAAILVAWMVWYLGLLGDAVPR
jgi:hypothetical protein